MYLQIENKFKKNSKIRTSQLLFIFGALLLAITCSMLLDLIKSEENYWGFLRFNSFNRFFCFLRHLLCFYVLYRVNERQTHDKSIFQH